MALGETFTDFFPSRSFEKSKIEDQPDHFRFAIVRDPTDRLISAYSSRVLQHNELSGVALNSLGAPKELPFRPSLAQYIDRFEEYRLVSASICQHTDPQVFFLGADPSYFDKVCRLDQLLRLEEFLSSVILRKIKRPHKHRDSARVRTSVTGPPQSSSFAKTVWVAQGRF